VNTFCSARSCVKCHRSHLSHTFGAQSCRRCEVSSFAFVPLFRCIYHRRAWVDPRKANKKSKKHDEKKKKKRKKERRKEKKEKKESRASPVRAAAAPPLAAPAPTSARVSEEQPILFEFQKKKVATIRLREVELAKEREELINRHAALASAAAPAGPTTPQEYEKEAQRIRPVENTDDVLICRLLCTPRCLRTRTRLGL
jgi:hypothetical protein